MVVKGVIEMSMLKLSVRREIEVEASPQEVWEALVDEDRRVQWLGEGGRDVEIEEVCAPDRLVWWWSDGEQPVTRVEVTLIEVPAGVRVVVTEGVPSFPLLALASCFAGVAA